MCVCTLKTTQFNQARKLKNNCGTINLEIDIMTTSLQGLKAQASEVRSSQHPDIEKKIVPKKERKTLA